MSTRGFISFAVDGETKTAYNHHSSDPGWLGVRILSWARTADIDASRELARNLRVVDGESEPTNEDIAALQRFYNPSVGGRHERPTWYQLLRGTQGDAAAILASGYLEDGSGFPADSLFAEYGYVVDFDQQVLEAYVGFQERDHSDGRFHAMPQVENGYFPVRLVASWPLSKLPSDEEFCTQIEAAESALAAQDGGE